MIDKKAQPLTKNTGHLAESANFKVYTFNKIYSGLIGWCFKMPNAPYSKRGKQ